MDEQKTIETILQGLLQVSVCMTIKGHDPTKLERIDLYHANFNLRCTIRSKEMFCKKLIFQHSIFSNIKRMKISKKANIYTF